MMVMSASAIARAARAIARMVASVLSITRSAIIAEETAGPGCRAGASCAALAWCVTSVGRHASAVAPISRHHSRGLGACWRAGDCWGGGASGAACRASHEGSGVGVDVGVRLGTVVGSGGSLGGGVVRGSGRSENAPVSVGGAPLVAKEARCVRRPWLCPPPRLSRLVRPLCPCRSDRCRRCDHRRRWCGTGCRGGSRSPVPARAALPRRRGAAGAGVKLDTQVASGFARLVAHHGIRRFGGFSVPDVEVTPADVRCLVSRVPRIVKS